MRRSQTVDSEEKNGPPATLTHHRNSTCGSSSGKDNKEHKEGSRRQRWSFALKRRWFSSSTSRSSRDSKCDSPIGSPTTDATGPPSAPKRTTLGAPTELDEPSSSTDRPEVGSANNQSATKRKSLRRIFANSGKDRQSSSPQRHSNGSVSAAVSSVSQPPPAIVMHPSEDTVQPSVLSTLVTATGGGRGPDCSSTAGSARDAANDDTLLVDGAALPPPMEDLALNNSHMALEQDSAEDASMADNEKNGSAEVEENKPSPEEQAKLKRKYVLMELVETEQDYVKDLTSVVEGYISNLEKIDLPQDLVGKDKIIFANIMQIRDFHRDVFCKEIEKCLENYDAVGSAFVKYEKRLRPMYVTYCQNKPKSDYLVSQDEFEQFFAETKAKLGHRVALSDLLIKPVQRIMKYQLLLKDILKFTERAKDNADLLKRALDIMHVVPKACDDMMQVGRLQNFDGSLSAQGNLKFQGTLSIAESVSGTAQKPKDRRIFLFEQSAIIADHIPPRKEFGNPQYIFKSQIMVNKMVLEKDVANDPLKFVIRSQDPNQTTFFIAQAATDQDKAEWITHLSALLDQQKQLLARLMNPKEYMGDSLGGGMAAMNLGNDKKAGGGGSSFSRFGSGSSKTATTSAPATKAESPKRESKSKSIFGFSKKSSAKSPTSPPPVGKLK